MKWFKEMDEDNKLAAMYFGFMILGLILLGIYTLADKLIDKL